MTICATHLALGNLFEQRLPRQDSPAHFRHIIFLLSTDMIEFQYYGVAFAAINARVALKIVE
ncbi:MAG: hypothetical protein ICV68_10495 [Pyrinomonadaceae bacterium]|nr:hypothetical protein [Pyrinomonadaceae bacterium]